MLKAKNILIIFMVNYLVMLIACCFLEMIFIGSKAQEAQLLMQTAADMALDQVQATDDFFTSAGGYLKELERASTGLSSDPNAYKMTVLKNDGHYGKYNLFEVATGETDYDNIYEKVYNENVLRKWMTDNPNVLGVTFTAGYTKIEEKSKYNFAVNNYWYQIPTLAQLGLYDAGSYIKIYSLNHKSLLSAEATDELWTQYGLRNKKKEVSINGINTHYFNTPLSLGVTYINEDLLQAFFMNNLELLMRSKYANRKNYNLNNEDCGFGVLKTAYYPELVDDTTLNSLNPINNGSFTLLRGEKIRNNVTSSNGLSIYKGIMPKVEYFVIDMYDNKYNDLLQQVLGAKFSSSVDEAGKKINGEFAGLPVTGSNLKRFYQDSINMYKEVTNSPTTQAFDHKSMVIAKVTFYADFIIPYNSVSLREMRGREKNDGTLDGRDIFNPFSGSQINIEDVVPITGNYVDIENVTDFSEFGSDSNLIYKNNVTRLGGNGDALTYTTFFAVTP